MAEDACPHCGSSKCIGRLRRESCEEEQQSILDELQERELLETYTV